MPVVVPHTLVTRLSHWLLRRIAPPNPSRFLTVEQMHELAPRIQRVNRIVPIVWLGSAVLLTVLFTLCSIAIYKSINAPPTDDAIYVSQPLWFLVFPSLFFALIAGVVPGRLAIRRLMDGDIELHDRYEETKNGFDERRATFIGAILLLGIGLFAGYVICCLPEIVDATGIRYADGLSPAHRNFDSVKSVELYTAIDAPVGIVHNANLQVRFKVGSPFRLIKNKGDLTPAKLREIAKYISEKSGVRVTYGDVRPAP